MSDYQTRHNYMLLSRLQQDCEYFLGYGAGSESCLYSGSVEEHIEDMKSLHNGFSEKPDWLTMEQIEEYERQMLKLKAENVAA